MKVPVEDLLDIPYRYAGTNRATGVDCLYTCRRVLERVFPDLAPSELPMSEGEAEIAISAVRLGLNRWSYIGKSGFAATVVGDVIHARRPDGGAGVAVVIDDEGRIALTATPDRGVHRIPIRKIEGVEAVYRRSTR